MENRQEMLLDLPDFILQEWQEDDLIAAISRVWYNWMISHVRSANQKPGTA